MSNSRFALRTVGGQIKSLIEGNIAYLNDLDAQAFIDVANITDSTQQFAINQLVNELKNYGLWTKMIAIYPFVGGSPSTHKWNLKDPRDLDAAFRLTFIGGITHNFLGITFGGINGYANSYINTLFSLQNTSVHLSVYSRSVTVGTECEIGMFDNSLAGPPIVQLRVAANSVFGTGNGAASMVFPVSSDARGFWTSTKRANNDREAYLNGSTLVTNTTNDSIAYSNRNLFIGARNDNPAILFSTKQLAFASIGEGLTDSEAANLYTAVQSFQINLSREALVDPDAQAFTDSAGITNSTQKSAINQLVISLKTYGLWTKMKAIYPFVGGTSTTHKFNLKDPRDLDVAYRLSFFGDTTHSSNGVTFNGTNGYADTFMAASSALTTNNNSLSYYSRTSAASSDQFAIDIGAVPNQNVDPSLYCLIIRRSTSNVSAFVANTSSSGVGANTTTTNGSGLFTGSITSSSSRKLYRNGNSIATNTTNASQSLPSQKIFIGAISNNNVASLFSGVRECAFVSIGDGLSDTESANLYTTIQDFQTTLSRQIN